MTAAGRPSPDPTGGRLFLVVGPSGAGKDTLIGEARRHLGEPEGFAFPRRVITRPPHAGSEDFTSATVEDFEARDRRGAFALSWRSHGLRYGIPAAIDGFLAEGRRVVVNVSRTVIDTARARYADTRVIQVKAPASVVLTRLQERRRETSDDIARRLERAVTLEVTGPHVYTIDNGGPLDQAAAAFLAALRRA